MSKKIKFRHWNSNHGLKKIKFGRTTSNKEIIQVHKAVLACRSPVFAAMFEHGMSEARSDRVLIEDIDAEVLKEMLRFM